MNRGNGHARTRSAGNCPTTGHSPLLIRMLPVSEISITVSGSRSSTLDACSRSSIRGPYPYSSTPGSLRRHGVSTRTTTTRPYPPCDGSGTAATCPTTTSILLSFAIDQVPRHAHQPTPAYDIALSSSIRFPSSSLEAMTSDILSHPAHRPASPIPFSMALICAHLGNLCPRLVFCPLPPVQVVARRCVSARDYPPHSPLPTLLLPVRPIRAARGLPFPRFALLLSVLSAPSLSPLRTALPAHPPLATRRDWR